MRIYGLCGGSGSGKTTVSQVFKEKGWVVINADDVYHDMISKPGPCIDKIAEEFGKTVINADGTLNRRALANIVFNDYEKLNQLNIITHPMVVSYVRRLVYDYDEKGIEAILIDMPGLYESGYHMECYRNICVYASKKNRIDRIMKRDNISLEEAYKRVDSQISSDFLDEACDYTIRNNKSLEDLRMKALTLQLKLSLQGK